MLQELSLHPARCEGTKGAQKVQGKGQGMHLHGAFPLKQSFWQIKTTLAKRYQVPSMSRWGWGKKNRKAAEAEEEEFNISICSYPNKLRCICGSVREARRNETIK